MSEEKTKIDCKICGAETHSIQIHIREVHANEWTLAQYHSQYPKAPLLSAMAQARLDKARADKAREEGKSVTADMATVAMLKPRGGGPTDARPSRCAPTCGTPLGMGLTRPPAQRSMRSMREPLRLPCPNPS